LAVSWNAGEFHRQDDYWWDVSSAAVALAWAECPLEVEVEHATGSPHRLHPHLYAQGDCPPLAALTVHQTGPRMGAPWLVEVKAVSLDRKPAAAPYHQSPAETREAAAVELCLYG